LFERFVLKEFDNNNKKSNVDKLIQQLKNGKLDPYDIINVYCLFIQNNYNVSSITFRDKITTVKTFLEFNDIETSPRKFKLKVRYPKTIFKNKEAIDKEDIIKVLNGCSNLRLKTYVMLLANTGARATETLSIRNRDLRKITLHSFRRYVRTTISDLGYADYSEWFIGHSGSTYWRKKYNEKAETFKKIEPYLTFLNIQQLNRQGADLETKIEELHDINHL